jgi:hypothetical protein
VLSSQATAAVAAERDAVMRTSSRDSRATERHGAPGYGRRSACRAQPSALSGQLARSLGMLPSFLITDGSRALNIRYFGFGNPSNRDENVVAATARSAHDANL